LPLSLSGFQKTLPPDVASVYCNASSQAMGLLWLCWLSGWWQDWEQHLSCCGGTAICFRLEAAKPEAVLYRSASGFGRCPKTQGRRGQLSTVKLVSPPAAQTAKRPA